MLAFSSILPYRHDYGGMGVLFEMRFSVPLTPSLFLITIGYICEIFTKTAGKETKNRCLLIFTLATFGYSRTPLP
jgi:hypothetical protein